VGPIHIIVVYKVDRLTRSLADFAKLVELFDAHGVSFVSVTQQFNTTTSMGRLTLNVLLSFAQFEREVTSERIRDKIAASKRKGLWVGGMVPLGYILKDGQLHIHEEEANIVRLIFQRYLEIGSVPLLPRSSKASMRPIAGRTKKTGRTISRSAYAFCQGERGDVGRSRVSRGTQPNAGMPGWRPSAVRTRLQQNSLQTANFSGKLAVFGRWER